MTGSRAPSKPRPRRADALRNQRRIDQAASEVFAELGMRATIAEVAQRAGVGPGTVHRSYPTKSSLLAAVAISWLRDWSEVAQAAAAQDDPATAFRQLTFDLFEQLRQDRFAIDLLRAQPINDEVEAARAEVERHVTVVMDRAREAGALRPEVTYAEMAVLTLGSASRLAEQSVTDVAMWHRVARLVIAGLMSQSR